MTQEEMFEAYRGFVNDSILLKDNSLREQLILAAMGVAGEAGEVCDELKKITMHDKVVDMASLLKEMGDVLWYYTVVMNALGITWEEIMVTNVEKLVERYPDIRSLSADLILDHERSEGCASPMTPLTSGFVGDINLVDVQDLTVARVVKAPLDFEYE